MRFTIGKVSSTRQTQNIYITYIQRGHNVLDVGPPLYKCYTNVWRLLGKYRATKTHTTL